MRLIDADYLATKIMMEAPDFMDGGSSITKAFILAMVKTRSVIPTVDAVPVVRCKDCKFRQSRVSRIIDEDEWYYCEIVKDYKPSDWYCADGERRDNDV